MQESSLIGLAQAGDAAAFASLIDRHAVRAYRIAYIIAGNHHDAEDAVQEACLVAYRSLGTLRDEGSFAGWFGQIVANRARDLVRRHRASRQRDERLAVVESAASSDEAVELREIIGGLGEPHRTAIWLTYSGDLSSAEVARVMGRPPGTVRRILSEAYGKLRQMLGGVAHG